MSTPPWHEAHWQRLQSRQARGALPHALLLCGPAGLGKRDFLQRFVRGLFCGHPRGGEACGRCRACLLLDAGTHPDFMTVSYGLRKDGVPRKEIVVDQIRELSARLAMASQFGGWQVVVIDPADAMNAAAANALLKTLEEPSPQTLLLLVADAPWRLPQTIRSRCQRIEFQLPSHPEAMAWLVAHNVADPAAALEAAGGNPGLARAWAEQGALARRQAVRKDLAALAAGRAEPMEVARRWLDSEPEQCLWFAAQACVDEARARAAGGATPLGSQLDDERLADWFAAANRTRDALRGPLRGDLLLLELLADWH
ncbi:DNA polymerase III subunit delta' [Frateuria terrea]|uniref:DNA-directed DNA polymerase n=1 Tax=Frateuria terrea TaxID=529704 RepID=A0A1H6Z2F1_9GAMM|nr:DNA polymerase III subunit delta' [Frateuria terrea]SEJ47649.1 DNA polymerase-3 subunit delta' [Frateuria terrea]SFP45614.1 DNA polymerase-3 subunit delta' [Frateuria terrea]